VAQAAIRAYPQQQPLFFFQNMSNSMREGTAFFSAIIRVDLRLCASMPHNRVLRSENR
jgi:hypothetical protein